MRILDATCGLRQSWFTKRFPGVTYIDIRPEVKPDLICDCANTPFQDREFDLIYFDPPHGNTGAHFNMGFDYGRFTIAQIRLLISKAFREFKRILKDDGIVIFKWSTHDMKLADAFSLAGPEWTPLFGTRSTVRTKHPASTYWVTLVKSKTRQGG